MDGNLTGNTTGIQYGVSITRREDDRFLTGLGKYVDDVRVPDALVAVFVRSPYPNARIVSIDAAAAREQLGVVAVLTAAEVQADGIDVCPTPFRIKRADGGPESVETPRPLLAEDRVRYVGEPVAVVIADQLLTALDAAELVNVEYEPADGAVTDPLAAAAPGAPRVWDDRADNCAYFWRGGGVEQIEAALAGSAHVVRLQSRITRVSAMSLEPRGALAIPDANGRMEIRLSHQSPHQFCTAAATIFKMDRGDIRVIAGDVGGSFGMKTGPLREELGVFWAARLLGRPVRWTATRSEAFLSDEQGRDMWVTAELGLDATGKFTALRVHYDLGLGAYFSGRSLGPVNNFGGIAGVYTTPVIVGECVGWFTHTPSNASYRGAGRPEATYAIERVIDVAAAELGIDPAELRRMNLIPPSAMPYQTPFVFKYDCGEFERNMVKAMEMADYAGFPARRDAARQRGKLRGIGFANPIEVAGGPYSKLPTEWAEVTAHPDGQFQLVVGAMSVGQGLETMLAEVVAQRLGVPAARVSYVQGDTDAIADGKGNGGSAGLILGGSAGIFAVEDLLERARAIVAAELAVAPEDLVYAAGAFRVSATGVLCTLAEVARIRQREVGLPLTGKGKFTPTHTTFPNGCHICEVEIDPLTGVVEVVNYVSAEDVGRVLNPLLVEGQLHGGVAQGLGQVLFEDIRFDDDGQLVTGSFMDYPMPRADDMPHIRSANPETPTQLNPLGVKGVGEAGTVGSLAAGMNAICNALLPAGIRHIDMPATPLRVWQALQQAGFKI